MSAAHDNRVTYIDALARLAADPATDARKVTCGQLADIMRFAADLNDRGVNPIILRSWKRIYARRLDFLGPDEFDRRILIGE